MQLNWPTAAACTGGMTGWYIVIFTSVAAGLYVAGGIGYGKRQYPDVDIASAHPHAQAWKQVPGLVSDGVFATRCTLSNNISFLAFLAPADHELLTDVKDAGTGGETSGLLEKGKDVASIHPHLALPTTQARSADERRRA